jgi:hypothetical protein
MTVFLAFLVFIVRLPVTIRRIGDQRKALRPVEPISRVDHLPCIVNTIGAIITEFALLGLLTLAVFLGSNAAFGTFDQAPNLSTAFRQISLGAIAVISALLLTTILLVFGARFVRYTLIMLLAFVVVLWMVISSTGDQWPAIALFGFVAYAVPALFVFLLRRLF